MSRTAVRRLVLLLSLVVALAAAATAGAVPRPSRGRADRFGVYHWSVDYSARPEATGKLRWGADKVAELGSRTIRVFLGASNVYGLNPDDNDPEDDRFLQRIAATPEWDAFFRDPRFRTYLLTVYTPLGIGAEWKGGFDEAEFRTERAQIAALGAHLVRRHPGKTFILLNWEGDHATASLAADSPDWEAFTRWIEARVAGVEDVRRQAAGGRRAKLYVGLEFNFVEKTVERNGVQRTVRCGEAGVRCIIDSVAPHVAVDYYSYSAWQTLNVKLGDPAASLKNRLTRDLGFALRTVEAARPEVGPESFIVGEFGFARSLFGECDAAAHTAELMAALEGARSFGASYAIAWQVLDHRWRLEDGGLRNATQCGQPDWSLYGLFRGRDGRLSLQGAAFRAALSGRRVERPEACPAIAPGGVVTPSLGFIPTYRAGVPVAIFGEGFAAAGNRVRILQAHDPLVTGTTVNRFLAVEGGTGDPAWSESPSQITATLPDDLGEGCALLFVETADGLDSNAVQINIGPRPGPRSGPGATAGAGGEGER